MILLLPLLIAFGALTGNWLESPFARMHPTVRLAERIQAEMDGNVQGTIDASDAFRNTGRPVEELYGEAAVLAGKFAIAGTWLGAWIGLVIGVKLIHLSLLRRRTDYEPDRSKCVSCGRCFWYCPHEQSRLGLIDKGLGIGD
jgi:NosR/NirI family transcriptional regulator, nitrous oxide reductase regulator